MKSAYLTLGVPGNASKDDIEAAFDKAKSHYSPARLGADPQALDKFLDVKTAYQVLRDDESRAAHDRKLSSARASPALATRPARAVQLQIEPQASWPVRALPVLAMLVVLVLATGFYINAKHGAARKERAAQELQLKQKAEEEAKIEEIRLAKEEADRLRAVRQAEQQDRQFRQESERAISNVRAAEAQRSYQETQRQYADQREAQRKEFEAKAREQTIAREAQQRLAMDKARIRELCYQNYRRTDC